jgi:hypothetical protein
VYETYVEVVDALGRLEDTLRAMLAPYSVDHDCLLVKVAGRWQLRFVVTTHEVLGVTRFASEEDVELTILRNRRVDTLNIVDLLHGKARGGRAIVLEEGVTRQVNSRYLPVLQQGGELRNLFDHDEVSAGVRLRAQLVDLLPEELRPYADEIGTLAGERRAALEELGEAYKRRRLVLIEPMELFFDEAWLSSVLRVARWRAGPELQQRLRRFSVHTDLEAPARARLERAREALLDALVLGVERHEAWHLLVPNPRTEAEGTPAVHREIVAYLGSLADAGHEFPLVEDHLHLLFKSADTREGASPTDIAVRVVTVGLMKRALEDKSLPRLEPGALAGGSWKAMAKQRQQYARDFLRDQYGEERSLRVLSRRRGTADLQAAASALPAR